MRGVFYKLGVAWGDTRVQMIGNLARLSGFFLAVWAVNQGWGVTGIAYSVILAEVLSIATAGIWLQWSSISVFTLSVGGPVGILIMVFLLHLIPEAQSVSGDVTRCGIGLVLTIVGLLAGFRKRHSPWLSFGGDSAVHADQPES